MEAVLLCLHFNRHLNGFQTRNPVGKHVSNALHMQRIRFRFWILWTYVAVRRLSAVWD